MGIWPPDSDGTEINSVSRSPSGRYLLTADDHGKVRGGRLQGAAAVHGRRLLKAC